MLNTQLNVDSVAMQQENLITTAQTAKALEQTQKVMSKQLEELDVDKIADVQDDLNDLMMDMEEVNEVMGRNYALDNIDEGELDAEFDAIEEEMKMEHFNEVGRTRYDVFGGWGVRGVVFGGRGGDWIFSEGGGDWLWGGREFMNFKEVGWTTRFYKL